MLLGRFRVPSFAVIVGFLGRLRGALGSAEVLISQAIFFEGSEGSQTN